MSGSPRCVVVPVVSLDAPGKVSPSSAVQKSLGTVATPSKVTEGSGSVVVGGNSTRLPCFTSVPPKNCVSSRDDGVIEVDDLVPCLPAPLREGLWQEKNHFQGPLVNNSPSDADKGKRFTVYNAPLRTKTVPSATGGNLRSNVGNVSSSSGMQRKRREPPFSLAWENCSVCNNVWLQLSGHWTESYYLIPCVWPLNVWCLPYCSTAPFLRLRVECCATPAYQTGQ